MLRDATFLLLLYYMKVVSRVIHENIPKLTYKMGNPKFGCVSGPTHTAQLKPVIPCGYSISAEESH